MMAARVLSPKKISLVKSPIAIGMIVPCHYDGTMTQDLSLAIRAAKDAGRIIRKAYGKSKIIMSKHFRLRRELLGHCEFLTLGRQWRNAPEHSLTHCKTREKCFLRVPLEFMYIFF